MVGSAFLRYLPVKVEKTVLHATMQTWPRDLSDLMLWRLSLMCIDPDGRALYVAGADGDIREFALIGWGDGFLTGGLTPPAELTRRLTGARGQVVNQLISARIPDAGRVLFAACGEQSAGPGSLVAIFLDVPAVRRDGSRDREQPGSVTISVPDSAWAVAAHPETRLVAVGSNAHKISLFRIVQGDHLPLGVGLECWEHARELVGHDNNIPCVAFSPRGRFLISCSIDGSARLWDLLRVQRIGHFTLNLRLGGERDWGWSVQWVPRSSVKRVSIRDATFASVYEPDSLCGSIMKSMPYILRAFGPLGDKRDRPASPGGPDEEPHPQAPTWCATEIDYPVYGGIDDVGCSEEEDDIQSVVDEDDASLASDDLAFGGTDEEEENSLLLRAVDAGRKASPLRRRRKSALCTSTYMGSSSGTDAASAKLRKRHRPPPPPQPASPASAAPRDLDPKDDDDNNAFEDSVDGLPLPTVRENVGDDLILLGECQSLVLLQASTQRVLATLDGLPEARGERISMIKYLPELSLVVACLQFSGIILYARIVEIVDEEEPRRYAFVTEMLTDARQVVQNPIGQSVPGEPEHLALERHWAGLYRESILGFSVSATGFGHPSSSSSSSSQGLAPNFAMYTLRYSLKWEHFNLGRRVADVAVDLASTRP